MQLSVAVQALSSLSQETRLSIFRMLVTAGPDGVAAGKIAEGLNVPSSTLSFHLTHLANAELIIPKRLNERQVKPLAENKEQRKDQQSKRKKSKE